MSRTALDKSIRNYYEEQCVDPTAGGRAWDHCNLFFRKRWKDLDVPCVQDIAALHLGCYLASWGMYRRSSFLSERAYTVHKPVISVLASCQFSELWQRDIGAQDEDIELVGTIMELVEEVDAAYRKVDVQHKRLTGKPPQKKMDTVVTKVLLSTLACLPARDRFFEKGLKHEQAYRYGGLNRDFVQNTLKFCINHRPKLAELQREVVDVGGRPYPLMKLVDMHFWQIGWDLENGSVAGTGRSTTLSR